MALKVESSGALGLFPPQPAQLALDLGTSEPPLLIPMNIVFWIWSGDAFRISTGCLGLLSDRVGPTSLSRCKVFISKLSGKAGSKNTVEGHSSIPRGGALGLMARLPFLRLLGSFQL